MRLQALEKQAIENPVADMDQQTFNKGLYPKLLACSSGDVPTLEDALQMPSTELDKWFFAVKRLNPDWFDMPGETVKEDPEKKSRKRTGSTHA